MIFNINQRVFARTQKKNISVGGGGIGMYISKLKLSFCQKIPNLRILGILLISSDPPCNDVKWKAWLKGVEF